MSIPWAVDVPVTLLSAEAERDRSGTSRVGCLGFIFHRSREGINPVVACIPPFFICQMRPAVFLAVNITETDGKPKVNKSDMAEGAGQGS